MLNLQEEAKNLPRPIGLVLVRGVSGSGKSTFVSRFWQNLECSDIRTIDSVEADQYFTRPDKTYDFNPKLLKNAHEYCFSKVVLAMGEILIEQNLFGSPINGIVFCSNTFTQKWEMQKYLDHAANKGVPVRVYRMVSQYENTHNVPAETVQKMKDRFEDFEGEILVDQYE
jgi:hypothetical protein